MPFLQDVVAEINNLLDAGQLLRLINYYPEKIARTESSGDSESAVLKGYCPIHKERAFRSLIVYEDQKRFTCTYLKCPGKSGGTLLELYAMVKELPLPAAALELIEALQLPVDFSSFKDLSAELAQDAAKAMEAGKPEEALPAIDAACSISGEDCGLRRLRAQVLRALGREDEALETELQVADLFHEQGDLDAAIDLLEGLHNAYPDLSDIVTRLAELLGEANRNDEQKILLKSICERLLASSGDVTNLEPFETYLSAAPDDETMRQRLADLYLVANAPAKAAQHLEYLIRAKLKNNEPAVAMELLGRLGEIDSTIPSYRILHAMGLRKSGQAQKATAELIQAADEAREAGQIDQSGEYLRTILTDEPEHAEALIKLAGICQIRGELTQQIALQVKAANVLCEQAQYERSVETLRVPLEVAPLQEDVLQARNRIFNAWFADAQAGKDLLLLAELAYDFDSADVARNACLRVLRCDAPAPELVISALDLLNANGFSAEASTECATLVHAALKSGDTGAALMMVRHAVLLWSTESRHQDLLATTLLLVNKIDEAVGVLGYLAQSYVNTGQVNQALDAFSRALKAQPSDVDLQERLAAVARSTKKITEVIAILRHCASDLAASGKTHDALVPLRHILSLNPDHLDSLQFLSECLETLNKLDESAECFANLAIKAGALNDVSLGENAWKNCLRLAPGQPSYLKGYASFLMEHKDSTAALPVWRQFLAAARQAGAQEDLAEAFRILLLLTPKDDELRDQHLEWLIETGQTQNAQEELRKRRLDPHVRSNPDRLAIILKGLLHYQPEDTALILELAEACERKKDNESAAQYFRKAAELLRGRNELSSAAAVLERLLLLTPEDAAVRETVVELLLNQNDIEAAARHIMHSAAAARAGNDLDGEINWLQRMLSVRPNDMAAGERLAEVYIAKGMQPQAMQQMESLLNAAFEQGDHQRSVTLAQRVRDMDEANAHALRCLTESLMALRRNEEAGQVFLDWAKLATSAGDADTAIRCWRQLQMLNPAQPEWRENLAMTFEAKGSRSEACTEYNVAADLYEKKQDLESAARIWTKMLELGQDQTRLRYRLAEYRLKTGNTAQALDDLLEVISLASKENHPDDLEQAIKRIKTIVAGNPAWAQRFVGVLLGLGRMHEAVLQTMESAELLIKSGDLDTALALTESTLSQNPELIELRELRVKVILARNQDDMACAELVSLGNLLFEKKEFKKAEEAFFRTILIDPHYCEAREGLVHCFLQTRRSGKAFVELKTLARTYDHLNSSEKVAQTLLRALELRQEDQETRISLVEALLRIGKVEEARAHLKAIMGQPLEKPESVKQSINVYLQQRPDDLDGLRWRADLIALTESLDAALGDYRQLLTMVEERDRDQADSLFNELLGKHPDCLDIRRNYARFLDRIGERVASAEQWLVLLDAALEQEAFAFAAESAQEARFLSSATAALRARAAEALAAVGNEKDAAEIALSAAEAYFLEGNTLRGEQILLKAAALAPESSEVQTQALDILFENSMFEGARNLAQESIRRLLSKQKAEPAFALCGHVLTLFPRDSQLLGVQVEVLEKLGRKADIADGCQKWAEALEFENKWTEAEQAWRRGLLAYDKAELRLGIAQLLATHNQPVEAAAQYLAYALFWRKGMNAADAIEALEKAIVLDPASKRVHQELGHLYVLMGNVGKSRDVRLALARLQVEAGEDRDAIETYAAILKTHPDDIASHRALIEAAARAGDERRCMAGLHTLGEWLAKINASAEAIAVFRQALDRSPEDEKTLKALIRLYKKTGDNVSGAEMIEKRADLARKAGDQATALNLYNEALALNGNAAAGIGRIARKFIELDQRDQGLQLLHKQAELLLEQQARKEAIEPLRVILDLEPNDLNAAELLVGVYKDLDQGTLAIPLLKQLAEEAHAQGHEEEALRHRLDLKEIDSKDSSNLRELIEIYGRLGQDDHARALLMDLSAAYQADGNYPQAIECCMRVIQSGRDDQAIRRHLARLYEESGLLDEAYQEYEKAISLSLDLGFLNEAEDDLRHVLQIKPNATHFRDQYITLLERQGRTEDAIQEIIVEAERAATRNDYDRATTCLKRVAPETALSVDQSRRLIRISDVVNQDALSVEHRLALAVHYLQQGDIPEARILCDEAINRADDVAQVRLRLGEMFNSFCLPELASEEYLALARMCLEKKNLEEAARVAEIGLRVQDHNIALRGLVIEACLSLERIDEAYDHCFQLAETAFDFGAFPSAEMTLRRMMEMRPNDPAPRRRLAAVLRQMNNMDEERTVLHELALLLQSQGELAEACQHCRSILDLNGLDIQARSLLIELMTQMGQEKQCAADLLILAEQHSNAGAVLDATRVYEKLLGIDAENIPARQSFIQFLSQCGQHTRLVAESLELGRIFSARGQETNAIKCYEGALQLAPQDENLMGVLAAGYTRLKRNGRAIQVYRRILALPATQQSAAWQMETLEQILALDAYDVAARSQLIDLCKSANRAEDEQIHCLVLAEQLLERGLPDSAAELYQNLVARSPNQMALWQRLAEAHQMIGAIPELLNDYLALSRLYEEKGQFGEVCQLLGKMIELAPDRADLRRKCIECRIQMGEDQELTGEYQAFIQCLIARKSYEEALSVCDEAERHAVNVDEQRQAIIADRDSNAAPATLNPQELAVSPPIRPPVQFALSEVERMLLQKNVETWQTHLDGDGVSPILHAQLAEGYERLGFSDKAYQEWDSAADLYMEAGEIQPCIEICQRMLRRNPQDKQMRRRLMVAEAQKDSLKIIDGALSEIAVDISKAAPAAAQSAKSRKGRA